MAVIRAPCSLAAFSSRAANTWVEIDHDPGEVLFYEPVRLQETIEPWALTVGQTMQMTINGVLHRGIVDADSSRQARAIIRERGQTPIEVVALSAEQR